jgi:hypothetical protein
LANSAGTGLTWNATTLAFDVTGGGGGGGITAVVQDTNPSLGGNLLLNGKNISGAGNISITGNIGVSGTASLTGGLGASLNLNGNTINGNGFISTTGGVQFNLTTDMQLRRVVNGVNPNGYITTILQRGTFTTPVAVSSSDELGGILFKGYTSGSSTGIAGLISFLVDPTAVIAGGSYIKSQIVLSAATDTTQDANNAVLINSAGLVTSNAFRASTYFQLPTYGSDAVRTSAIPVPTAGMMVFMTSGTSPSVTNKAVVYNGTAWALLPG